MNDFDDSDDHEDHEYNEPGDEQNRPADSDTGPTHLLINEAVRLLEEQAEEAGWDQQSVLWRVDMPSVVDLAPELLTDSTFGLALGFVPIAEFECHPNEVLSGLVIDGPDCIGAALVTEAWVAPNQFDTESGQDGDARYVRPSEHPDRTEVRLVVMLLRDGNLSGTMRTRGSDRSTALDTGNLLIDGTVLRYLRRAIGLPSLPDGPDVDLESMRRRLRAVGLVLCVEQLFEQFGEPDDRMPGAFSVPPDIDLQLATWVDEIPSYVETLVDRTGFKGESWDEVLHNARTTGEGEMLGSPDMLIWFDAPLWADWLDTNIATTRQCEQILEVLRPCSPRFVDSVLILLGSL